MDDMLVKSKMGRDHIQHLSQMFNILRTYRIKLNLLKYAFRVESENFLGFKVNQYGIKANPEKINVLLEISSPRKPNEVISLAGRVAALSLFVLQQQIAPHPFLTC